MPEPAEKPLQSWKEIAAYLERDVRTAYRWEKDAGLPVRRHPGAKRSSVYAYPSEIEAWRKQGREHSETAPPDVLPIWRRPAAWAAAAAAVAAFLGVFYGPILNPRDPVAEAAEDAMRSERVWTDADYAMLTAARLSPDGRWFSYPDFRTGDLALRDARTGAARRLTDKGGWAEDASYVESSALSPGSERVAYGWFDAARGTYQLRVGKVPDEGASLEADVLFESPPAEPGYIEVGGWLSETRVLFVYESADRTVRLQIADVESGRVEPLKSLGWNYPRGITISPDRAWIAYGLKPDPLAQGLDILVLAADGSQESTLVEHPADDAPVAWTPEGDHLLFRSGRTGRDALWAIAVADGRPAGSARLVNSEVTAAGAAGLTPQGELYYLKRAGTTDLYEARINPQKGAVERGPEPLAVAVFGSNHDPVYSPDGKFLAYIANRSLRPFADTAVVVRDLETGEERDYRSAKLHTPRDVVWSPDSESLLFRARDAKGRYGLHQMAVEDGSTQLVLKLEGGVAPRNYGLLADGRSLHYLDSAAEGDPHKVRDLATGEEREILPPGGDFWLTTAPDGRRFAGVERRREEGESLLFTLDLEGRRRDLLRLERPEDARRPVAWTPDGESILFWKRTRPSGSGPAPSALWALPVDGGDPHPIGLAVEDLSGLGSLSLHPDGRRLAYSAGRPRYEIWKLSNFLGQLRESD